MLSQIRNVIGYFSPSFSLFDAINRDDSDEVARWLKKNPKEHINTFRNGEGLSLLACCCKDNRLTIALRLLLYGANPYAVIDDSKKIGPVVFMAMREVNVSLLRIFLWLDPEGFAQAKNIDDGTNLANLSCDEAIDVIDKIYSVEKGYKYIQLKLKIEKAKQSFAQIRNLLAEARLYAAEGRYPKKTIKLYVAVADLFWEEMYAEDFARQAWSAAHGHQLNTRDLSFFYILEGFKILEKALRLYSKVLITDLETLKEKSAVLEKTAYSARCLNTTFTDGSYLVLATQYESELASVNARIQYLETAAVETELPWGEDTFSLKLPPPAESKDAEGLTPRSVASQNLWQQSDTTRQRKPAKPAKAPEAPAAEPDAFTNRC